MIRTKFLSSQTCCLLMAMLLLAVPALAQPKFELIDEIDLQKVVINEPDGYIKAEVLDEDREIKVKQTLFYYWYQSNKIMTTQGGYSGKVLHGEFTAFYNNKQLKEKGEFRLGLKNGTWTSWYDTGTLKEISHWNMGQQEGWSEQYNDQGVLQQKRFYKDGAINEEAGASAGKKKRGLLRWLGLRKDKTDKDRDEE